MMNALRATPEGGPSKSSWKPPLGGRLSPWRTREGNPPENLRRVFDRFYREDRSRSRETGGTGLGLAVVKAIVEAHGGGVEAFSQGPGRGSRFVIALPKPL